METVQCKWQYGFVVACYAVPCILLSGVLISPGVLAAIAFGYILCCITSKLENLHLTTAIVIITFGIAEVIILFEILPLVWLSIFNAALVFLLHGFLGHTGMWFIIEFGVPLVQFQIIEIFMFSTYPAMCSLLYTWFLSSVTDVRYTPYFLSSINFVIYQLCAKPRVASITVKDKPQPILDSAMVGCIMLGQCLLPMLLFGIKTLITTPHAVTTLQFMLEGYFIFSQSVFLSTLLPIKSFIEATNIPKGRIVMLRWIAGSTSLMLLLPILKQYGFETEMMASLKWKLILFILLVAIIPNKKRKNVSIGLSLSLIVVYVWQINDLPWSLRFPGLEVFRHILSLSVVQFLYIMLGLNLILSVTSIWSYIYSNTRTFSLVFLLTSTVFLTTEWIMYALFIAPRYGLIISSAVYVYAVYILSRNERLLHLPCVLCLSIVCSKLFFLTCHWVEGHRLFYGLSTFLLVIPVLGALIHILLIPDITRLVKSKSKILLLCGLVILPVVLLYEPLFAPFIAEIFMVELSRIHLIGLSAILIGLCFCRAIPIQSLPMHERMCGSIAVAYGFLIIIIRLYFSTLWCSLLSLFLLGGMVGVGLLMQQSDKLYQRQRIIIAAVVGILFGAVVTFFINFLWEMKGSDVAIYLVLNSCTGLVPLLCFYFPAMVQERYVPLVCQCGLAISLVPIVTSMLGGGSVMPGLMSAAIFSISTPIMLTSSEEKRKNDEVVLTFSTTSSFSWISNGCVLMFCAVGLLAFRLDFSNPLLPFLSLALFLLQRSKSVLGKLNPANRHIPPLLALSVFLLVGVISQSPCVFPPSNALRYWHYYLLLRGWAELLACVALLPIHWMYLQFNWTVAPPANHNHDASLSECRTTDDDERSASSSMCRAYPSIYYSVTLFLLPVCLLFILSTSYSAYSYGVYSLFMSISILANK